MSPTAVPENSCFLIFDPTGQNLELLAPSLREGTRARFASLDDAANIAKIPRYFSTHHPAKNPSAWISKPCEKNRKRIFDCPETGSAWHNDELVTAIKSENRERLFICGFWLDIDLGPAAIEAFVEGYNVHILTDLVFSRHAEHHYDGMSRLLQIGIVPMLTSQFIHEWMSWTSDRGKAAELKAVLDGIVG